MAENDYSVFVGDLTPEISDYVLQEHFRQFFPSVRGAKVIIDPLTQRSKGYGFVRFGNEIERDRALLEMNGTVLASRPIRVSIATKKAMPGVNLAPFSSGVSTDYDPQNTTLFVGGLSASISEDQLHSIFGRFGEIIYTKIPQGKGCGFVQYVDRKSAELAMSEMNGTVIGNSSVRISWGRSTTKSTTGTTIPIPMPSAQAPASTSTTSSFPTYSNPSYSSYQYDTSNFAAYGMYGNDPYAAYAQAYPGVDPYLGFAYGVAPTTPFPSALHPHRVGGSGSVGGAAVGSNTLPYDPLAPVNVDKLNMAYVMRQMPMYTGQFLRMPT